MTTMLGHSNMAPESAESRVHRLEEQTGVPWDQADPSLELAKVQHWDFLDTLILVDNRVKHSALVAQCVTFHVRTALCVSCTCCLRRQPCLPGRPFPHSRSRHAGLLHAPPG